MSHNVATLRDKARLAWATQRRSTNAGAGGATAGIGFVTGTRLVTPGGWATIDSLHRGDEVLTFDAGFQRLKALIRLPFTRPDQSLAPELWPLFVPAGVLENRRDLLVPPQQGVLVESRMVRDKWGDPFAVIPGAALEALDGVRRVEPTADTHLILPVFAEDQMVFANGGALLFSQSAWGAYVGVQPRFGRAVNYNMMPVRMAVGLLQSGDVRNVKVRAELPLAA